VALLSGGLDSAVAAACVAAEGRTLHTLAIDYGQRCRAELTASRAVSAHLNAASHREVAVDLRALGGSALTDDMEVPRDRTDHEIGAGVPVTYVPARNTVLLSVALGLAEVVGGDTLVIGANALDYSGYPDCRGPYLRAFEALARLATAAGTEDGVRFHVAAPLLEMSKADIVRKGIELGVPLVDTMSCYDPVERGGVWLHCGGCDSCALRRRGFREAETDDPTPYAGEPA
jgi:7-cyano-7-deazaguanine synthase